MLKHNMLLIFRNFRRDKSSFLINIIGLSTGLACALFIYLWVSSEIGIDKFHKNDSRLYQVMANFESPQGKQTKKITPIIIANAIPEEFPEVEYSAATNAFLFYVKEGSFNNGEYQFKAKGMFASKDFFNVFTYNIKQGDLNTAIANKSSIAISENLAKKLFNTTENVIGKSLQWDHPYFKGVFQVSGIFEDIPANSTYNFDVVFNIENLIENDPFARRWGAFYSETCLVLKEGTNVEQFNKKIAGYLKSKDSSNESVTLFIQRFSDKYLYGHYENGLIAGGRIAYVRLFSIVAVLILIIACINFMNLSTAKASTRIKEIGVKKTIGANRKSLIFQYFLESLTLTFISLLVAFIIIELLLPQFNTITQKNISLEYDLSLVFIVFCVTGLTGFVAGSYPALYLSGLNPVRVLKGKLRLSFSNILIRKGLVIFQFALSILFIVSVFVVYEQIEFTQAKNLGYDRDNIICFQWKQPINSSEESGNNFQSFITEIKNIPGVANATNMGGSILKELPGQTGCSWSEQESDKTYLFKAPFVSYDFIETLGLEIKEGRSFSRDFSNDDFNIILNEAAVRMMGIENPINKQIRFDMNIIGVMKDFNYGSLHAGIEPLILRFRRFNPDIMVKISAGREKATLEKIQNIYSEFNTAQPFEFTFMDDDYQALYDSEIRTGKLSKYFALLAIIISCLGLFGLASFTAQKRRKEIGIRKVLGSSQLRIIYLFSSEFTLLVFISILISLPISYIITKSWLQDFSYRVDIEWWVFVTAGAIALLIALATISYQAVKAALANPVESLKCE